MQIDTAASIPDALKNFDSLPDSKLVGESVVRALLGDCSSATLGRKVKRREMPQPYKLSPQTRGWKVGELRKWLAELPTGTPSPVKTQPLAIEALRLKRARAVEVA
jgi:predicted DNA-binding transcriptional regulator AlpA